MTARPRFNQNRGEFKQQCCCPECRPRCKPCCPDPCPPCPPVIDCCPPTTPPFATIILPGLDPIACVGEVQEFQICTSASCNLVGHPVTFTATLSDPNQFNNVTVFFVSPTGAKIPVPFNESGVATFPVSPPLPVSIPLRQGGCSNFTISFDEVGLYILTVRLFDQSPPTPILLTQTTVSVTVSDCPL